MSEPLSVILWASRGRMFETNLLGRPLWQWTLAMVRSLGPRRILLIGDGKAPSDLQSVQWLSRGRLSATMGHLETKVILMSAELPCIRSRTLKRLAGQTHSAPRCLISAGEEPRKGGTVISSSAQELKKTLTGFARREGISALEKRIQASPIAPTPHEELLEVLSAADWALAAQIFRRRKCEKLLAGGVFLDDPSTAHIDPDVRVGRGTRIHGWVVIEGASRIGGNCEIGNFSHIVDSMVGARTVLLDHCFIRSSRIGKGAQTAAAVSKPDAPHCLYCLY